MGFSYIIVAVVLRASKQGENMRRNIVGFFFVCLVSFQASSLHAQDAIRDLVVKIHAVHHTPDLLRPWARNSPQQVKGSGVGIDGKRILTNAQVVRDARNSMMNPFSTSVGRFPLLMNCPASKIR